MERVGSLENLLVKMFFRVQLDTVNGKLNEKIDDNLYKEYIRHRIEIWRLLPNVDRNKIMFALQKSEVDPGNRVFITQLLSILFLELRYKQDPSTLG